MNKILQGRVELATAEAKEKIKVKIKDLQIKLMNEYEAGFKKEFDVLEKAGFSVNMSDGWCYSKEDEDRGAVGFVYRKSKEWLELRAKNESLDKKKNEVLFKLEYVNKKDGEKIRMIIEQFEKSLQEGLK